MFPETCAIGAPVFDPNDAVIAVLSIGAPRTRINAKTRDRLAGIVVEAANGITLSYRRRTQNER